MKRADFIAELLARGCRWGSPANDGEPLHVLTPAGQVLTFGALSRVGLAELDSWLKAEETRGSK